MVNSKRISITVSNKELDLWKSVNHRESLSAFIREVVNKFVKIKTPDKEISFYDYLQNHDKELIQLKKRLSHLERIEGDLIDLAAVLANKEMIDIVKDQWEIKKKEKK
jgi:hypothetical protein